MVLNIANIWSLQLSSHTFMEIHILQFPCFYRFLLNRNVDQYIFIFFERMLFHPLCYLKRALFRLEYYPEFSRFLLAVNGVGSKTLSVIPWISQTFKTKSITECFLGSKWQIHLNRQRVIIYINFGGSQPLFPLKEQLLLS